MNQASVRCIAAIPARTRTHAPNSLTANLVAGWLTRLGLVCGVAVALVGISSGVNADEPAQSGAAVADAPADSAASKDTAKEAPDFVRVRSDDGKPQALQTAIAKYALPGDKSGTQVTLVGAVHIAEATYYSRLNQMFRNYDALLFEMVMDPEMDVPDPEERGLSPVSTIQTGMKDALELTFQLDEIDYKAKNFVHADMTPTEFFDTMEKRQESLFSMVFRSIGSGLAMQSSGKSTGDIDLIAAMVSKDRAKALRRAFASQMEMMDGQMAALTGDDGKSTLITERNAKAFEVLDEQMDHGKQKIGIFYGGGHLKDMHERLTEEYGMELVEMEWLDAWDLQ